MGRGRHCQGPTRSGGIQNHATLWGGDLSSHASLPIIVGKYQETGRSNHAKPVYLEEKDPGTPWDVLIYYWDKRDGARYSGWWFGSSVGGNQVWARSGNDGPMPPRGGWAIPWTTSPREDFEVTEHEPEGSDQLQENCPRGVRGQLATCGMLAFVTPDPELCVSPPTGSSTPTASRPAADFT